VVDDRGQTSYLKLALGAMYVARLIRRATDRPHVGVMLPTSGAFPVCLLGTWMNGRVIVPLNYLLKPDELAYVVDDSEIDAILTAKPMVDYLGGEQKLRELIPDHVQLVKLDEQKFSGIPPLRRPPRTDDDQLAAILYTSGTSGKPKGVMLSHGNLESDVLAGIEHSGLSDADTFLGVLPQFHSFGFTALTLIPLAIGAKVVYAARFVPRRVVELIRKHRPQIVMAVPSMYAALLSVKGATAEDFASLRCPISGGEPLSNAVFDQYMERFNVKLLEGYGLTETSPATHWCTPTQWKRHSVGRPLPGVKQLIVDEQGGRLGPDEEGEVLLGGPTIMLGYFKLGEETRDVFTEIDGERYFRTGDIGRIDEDGYLYVTGRKKEMMIVGGENVFPREIEEVLNRHASVRASAVIGRADPVRGETPVAFVEAEEGATVDASALRAYCGEHLAGYKVPREVRTVESLPRTPTGKIRRRDLKPLLDADGGG